jgi:hypothetical protein
METKEDEHPPTSMQWETDEDWYIPEDMWLEEHYCWWGYIGDE